MQHMINIVKKKNSRMQIVELNVDILKVSKIGGGILDSYLIFNLNFLFACKVIMSKAHCSLKLLFYYVLCVMYCNLF